MLIQIHSSACAAVTIGIDQFDLVAAAQVPGIAVGYTDQLIGAEGG